MTFQDAQGVDLAREETGLSRGELFVRYFALGGGLSRRTTDAFLEGRSEMLPRVDYDMLVHGLNERFLELGQGYPLSYSGR